MFDPSKRFPAWRLAAIFAAAIAAFHPVRAVALSAPPPGGCYVYPSPAQGPDAWVVYDLPRIGRVLILVYDEAGDLVERQSSQGGTGTWETRLDLSHFHPGVYLCRVILQFDSGGSQKLDWARFQVGP